MSATIYDVAKKAGVGIGTVSRVINNSPQITDETKAKVLAAIKDLKYQPHALAQGLARKRTNMIAVVVPFFTGYFFLDLLKGIQKEVAKHNYDIILYSVEQPQKLEGILKRTLQERRVDGVILISMKIPENFVTKFANSNLSIILVDSYHHQIPSITVENQKGAFEATEYLISLGHRKIGMIDGQLKSPPARMRLDGYKQALSTHHIRFDPDYVVISDIILGADGFSRESGYKAMNQLLSLGQNRPTAVFVSSDIQAAGAIKAVSEFGMKIPDDLSIIGFDDIEIAEYMGLTTMKQPIVEMGERAVKRMMSMISEEAIPEDHEVFETQLVIRESSQPYQSQENS